MTQNTLTINAVLFDYGLVLTGPADPAAWAAMQGILGAEPEALHASYWRFRDDYDRGKLTGTAYWNAIARDLARTPDAAMISALIDADTAHWTQPNPAMIDWAVSLQARGIKTGILSNLGDDMEAGIHARLPWLQGFTHKTFSHRLGIAKPDLAIYRHAALGLGVPASEILFIDDREENIAAAQVSGMATICYTGHDDFMRAIRLTGLERLL